MKICMLGFNSQCLMFLPHTLLLPLCLSFRMDALRECVNAVSAQAQDKDRGDRRGAKGYGVVKQRALV